MENDADSLAVLARLPALRQLSVGVAGEARLPPSLSTVTQLERLIVSSLHDGATAVLATALPSLSGLTSLCLQLHAPFGSLAAVAQLPRLQRLLLTSSVALTANADDLALPPGPWLLSIRCLGLPWTLLEAGAEPLRGAPQLEYIFSDGTPQPGTRVEGWRAFWQFVATHAPLRCLAYAPTFSERAEVSRGLVSALFNLHHRRPELRLRQLDRSWGYTEHSFLHEILECQGIPSGPGSVAQS